MVYALFMLAVLVVLTAIWRGSGAAIPLYLLTLAAMAAFARQRHDDAAQPEFLMQRLYLLAATANAWVLIVVLLLAFGGQFAFGELPCPLCVTQRIALMLCILGPVYMLNAQRRGELTPRDVALSAGIGILSGLLGVVASSRQVLLHIIPNDPGYGSPVFGLHLYTWCLIVFFAHIAASGVLLVGTAWMSERRIAPWRYTGITVAGFVFVVVANIASVIAEAGPHWMLPENPTRYLLLNW